MKGKFLQKAIAAALVIAMVYGALPVTPLVRQFPDVAITANAEEDAAVPADSSTPVINMTVCDNGDTSLFAPYYVLDNDIVTGTQQIYPASMLSNMRDKELQSMTFYSESPFQYFMTSGMKVYLMEVQDTELSDVVDIENEEEAVKVFEGDYEWNGTEHTITFTAPYEYHGGNLLVCIGHDEEDDDQGDEIYFYGQEQQTDTTCYYEYEYSESFAFLAKCTFSYVDNKKYSVTWKGYDGSVLETDEEISPGDTPVYDGETPTKPEDDFFTYEFSGWRSSGVDYAPDTLPGVVKDTVYSAVFSKTPKYPLNMTVCDDTVTNNQAPYYTYGNNSSTGTQQIYPASMLSGMKDKEINSLTFYSNTDVYYLETKNMQVYLLEVEQTAISGRIDVENNANAVKVFDSDYIWHEREYTVAFDKPYVYHGGNLLVYIKNSQSDECQSVYFYGQSQSENTAYCYYGNDGSQINSFLAKCDFGYVDTNYYSVTWKNDDGTVLETDSNFIAGKTASYDGETPVKTDDFYDYTFTGWTDGTNTYSPDNLPKVSKNTEYTAVYSRTPKYPWNLTLTVCDGTVTNEYTPYYGYWSDSLTGTQQIYPASMLASLNGQEIKSLTFYSNGSVSLWASGVQVYLMEVEQTTISGRINVENNANAVKVFDSNYTWSGTEHTFNFTQPYTYHGRNLLVYIKNSDGNTYQPIYFYGQSQSDNTSYCYWNSGDGTAYSQFLAKCTFNTDTGVDTNYYDVVWKNHDGTVLETDDRVPSGKPASYDGTTPTKQADDFYTYEFAGWTDGTNTYSPEELPGVRKDTAFTAVFRAVPKFAFNLTVCDNTNTNGTIPYYTDHNYCQTGTQQIYPASMLSDMNGRAISSLTFYSQNNFTLMTNGMQVYLLEVDQTEISNKVDVENNANAVKVFDGDYQWNGNEHTIRFTTPYTYHGGNLLVYIKKSNQLGSSGWQQFYGQSQSEYTAYYYYEYYDYENNSEPVSFLAKCNFGYFDNSYHTVTWKNEDGTVLETDTGLVYGTMPSYDGETPVKVSDDGKDYVFAGWDKTVSAVTNDTEYTAVFKENLFTVTWVNYDGTVLEIDENVKSGDTPKYDSRRPSKTSTAQYSYTFSGWSPEITPVGTDNVTYTAQYTEKLRTYTVKWLNYDGTVLETDTKIGYGTIPTYDGATPVKSIGDGIDYVFAGWEPAVAEVTGAATYTAVFKENKFTVTWQDEDGTTLEVDENMKSGETPVYDGNTPAKERTAQYTYTFTGWSPEIAPIVTDDITYTAQYESTVNKYTITWKNEDGTLLETDADIEYGTASSYDGEALTKDEDEWFTYEFIGWDDGTSFYSSDSLPTVVDHAEYTAVFRKIPKNPVSLTVCDSSNRSSNRAPYYINYNTSYNTGTQQIYPASMLSDMKDKELLSMTFYMSSSTSYLYTAYGMEVYLMEVEQTSLSGRLDIDNAVKVFNGNYTWSGGNNTITFQKPYNYHGGNLFVYIRNTNGGSRSDSRYFYGQVMSENTNYCYYSGFSSLESFLAKCNFGYADTNKYTVTWQDENGNVLETDENVIPGTSASYDGGSMDKAVDDGYIYEFAGWNDGTTTYTSDNLPVVRKNTVYTATYTRTPKILTDRLTVCDGLEKSIYIPACTGYYANSNTRQIYPASMLSELNGQDLYYIKFYSNGSNYAYSQDMKVYLVEVDETTVSGTEDVENNPNAVMVYNGGYRWSGNEYIINFTQPYTYHGGNLLVYIKNPYEFDSETPNLVCYGQTQSDNTAYYYLLDEDTWHTQSATQKFLAKCSFGCVDTEHYSVTWKNEDGTVVETDESVSAGDYPVYDGEALTKAEDDFFTYAFAGWSDGTNTYAPDALPKVSGDTVYTACFEKTSKYFSPDQLVCNYSSTNSYVPYYIGVNGYETVYNQQIYPASMLSNLKDHKISSLTFYSGGNIPSKKSNHLQVYLLEVDQTTISAKIDAENNANAVKVFDGEYTWNGTEHTINFTQPYIYHGGNLLVYINSNQGGEGYSTYFYGQSMSQNTAYSYWYNKFGEDEYDSSDYISRFLAKCKFGVYVDTNYYSVIWKNHDGTALETDTGIPAGQIPSYDGAAPTKAQDDFFTYEFIGWTDGTNTYAPDALPKLLNDTIYTAVFSKIPKYYADLTVCDGTNTNGYTPYYGYWSDSQTGTQQIYPASMLSNLDGKEIHSLTFYSNTNASLTAYGVQVYLMEVEQTAFSGGMISVEGNANAVKVFEGDYNWNGTEHTFSFTQPYTYHGGNLLVYIKNSQSGSCQTITFYGQSQSGNTSYCYWSSGSNTRYSQFLAKCTFGSTVDTNYYTVTWKNEDGTVLETDEHIPAGKPISYDGAALTKAEDEFYTYEFAGWTDGTNTYPADKQFKALGNTEYTARFRKIPKCTWNKTVCDGTDTNYYVPCYTGWIENPQCTQQIYPASMLTGLKDTELFSLRFYSEYSIDVTTRNLQVYLLEVEDTTISGRIDVENNADAVKVFDGAYNWNGNEHTISFTEPYAYKGGNLLVCIKYDYNTNDYDTPFYGVSQSQNTAYDTHSSGYSSTSRFLAKCTFGYVDTNHYTVTWKDENGTVLETDEGIEMGTVPSYDGEIPTKADDDNYSYRFFGWTDGTNIYFGNDFPAVSRSVTYTAVMKAVKPLQVGQIFFTGDSVDFGEYYINTDSSSASEYGNNCQGIHSVKLAYDSTVCQYSIRDNDGTLIAWVTANEMSDAGAEVVSGTGTDDNPFRFRIVSCSERNIAVRVLGLNDIQKQNITLVTRIGDAHYDIQKQLPTLQTPYLDGYNLSGWTVNGSETVYTSVEAVQNAVEELMKDDSSLTAVEIKAVYEQKTATHTVTISTIDTVGCTIKNAAGETKDTYQVSEQLYAVADRQAPGQKFSHWEINGITVGYETTYAFLMPDSNVTLTAVYVNNDTEVTKLGTAYIESVKRPDDKKLSFVSILSVPEDATMLRAGIVACKQDDLNGTHDAPTIDYARFRKYNDTDCVNYKSFKYTWTKGNVSEEDTWCVRAYLLYRDADNNEHTVYGEVVRADLNSIAIENS